MEVGVIEANPSAEMHHIVAIVDSPTRRMDHMNWLAVCKCCHEQLEHDSLSGIAVKQWSIEHYEDEINGVY